MSNLTGQVAVVTGGTFGVGKGIAAALTAAGANVFITGRSAVGPNRIPCDHRIDAQTEAAFQQVLDEAGRIDILVNNVWGEPTIIPANSPPAP